MKSKILVILIMVLLVVSSGAPSTRVEAESPDPPITVYVVPPITDVKILPTTSISDSYISNDISIVASPGEYEPSSFVIHANEDVNSFEVEATGLTGGSGSIPSSNVDIRVVKGWYQSGIESTHPVGKYFVPELLLHDDSLIKVEGGENYIKLTSGEYVWISEATFGSGSEEIKTNADFPITDTPTLQPVDIPVGTNKQFWVTVKVPDGAAPGIYNGNIELRDSAGVIGGLQVEMNVLPIELIEPDLSYGVFHIGRLRELGPYAGTISSRYKNEEQYRAEMYDIFEHGTTPGVTYISEWEDTAIDKVLAIRNEVGLPTTIYVEGQILWDLDITTPEGEQTLRNNVRNTLALAASYGITSVYFMSKDEPTPETLSELRQICNIVHEEGGLVWVSLTRVTLNETQMGSVADCLDMASVSHAPSKSLAALYHSYGHKIFNFANPHGGCEMPETYRRNYGILLWQNDYDGAMCYAYQSGFGFIWNDFDHFDRRDMNFTYPTVNGVIDTTQWEGWREGVDDVRYLTTLLNLIEEVNAQGKDTSSAESWLADLKSSDLTTKDLDVVRSEMIDHILNLIEEAPLAEFSATPTTGNEPLDVQFTNQSTGSITSWLWDFGDEATSTEQNPLHIYTSIGVYTVSLTVTDSLTTNSDTETKTSYIIVYKPGDANQDGSINSLDITKVKRIIMGLDDPTPGADANGDGNINAMDITQIELIIMWG